MKRILRIGMSFVSAILVAVILQIQAGASTGTLTYWEDRESTTVYRWGDTYRSIPQPIYVNQLNGNDKFHFMKGFDHAFIQWGNALNRAFVKSASPTTSIKYYGGTKEQLETIGVFGKIGGELGATQTSESYEGTWKYGSYNRTVKRMNSARGYIVDCSWRDIVGYKNTCAHEFGHAMGWAGHTTDKDSVMYKNDNYNRIYLSSIDKRHLQQIYGIKINNYK